jgi:enterochelin esterase-like enzyme
MLGHARDRLRETSFQKIGALCLFLQPILGMKDRFSVFTHKTAHFVRSLMGGRYVAERLPSFSPILNREVVLDVFRPAHLHPGTYPLLILNDGQDAEALQIKHTVEKLWQRGEISSVIVACVHAGDRMQEYGVADEKDFAGRGSRAKQYTDFLLNELLPFLKSRFPIDAHQQTIAGFSLGALSAMDLTWNHPEVFNKVGAFSGSFWWRRVDSADKTFDEKKHRIMHSQIREGELKPGVKFWFQTGTKDEPFDRNGNGVIDSIDDTLDLIAELTKKGYRPFRDIVYHEIRNGEHNQHTWAQAMPHFLKWAFPAQM